MSVATGGPLDIEMFHSGTIVPDISAAIRLYGTSHRLRFTPPRQAITKMEVDGQRREIDLLVSYSLGTAPYLELIEERRGATFSAVDGLGLDHVGFWASDLDAAMARFAAKGMPSRVYGDGTQEGIARFSYHQAPNGLWIELVSTTSRDRLENWLATSEASSG